MIDQLTINKLQSQLKKVETSLSDPQIYNTPDFASLSAQRKELTQKILLLETAYKTEQELKAAQKLIDDPQMADLVQDEISRLEKELELLKTQIDQAMIPSDPNDYKAAIMEIRAGAGGDESSLFAGELARMYTRFGENQGLKFTILSDSPNEVGGYKEIIFEVIGESPYGLLKYESGVHRVQRVPQTESAGRVHTSTVTVAVLPKAEEADIQINPNDLRIDVYRSSGHGGQSVNTTDSAVRITHLPSGIVITCQDEKSQLKNKTKAMSVLRTRLMAEELEKKQQALGQARLSQIGTGDRSEKIRTYNFPQDRVTDHRINLSRHNLAGFMDGDIKDFLDRLKQASNSKSKA